jgi:hypothetical protein
MKGFLKIAVLLGLWGGLVVLEHRRPLRAENESKPRRNTRNLTVAALAAAMLHFVESPVLYPLAKNHENHGAWGADYASTKRRQIGLWSECDHPMT